MSLVTGTGLARRERRTRRRLDAPEALRELAEALTLEPPTRADDRFTRLMEELRPVFVPEPVDERAWLFRASFRGGCRASRQIGSTNITMIRTIMIMDLHDACRMA
jgi:hypothetical protein